MWRCAPPRVEEEANPRNTRLLSAHISLHWYGFPAASSAADVLAEQRQLAATRCEACGEPGVLAEHSRALGVAVCRECCRNDPQRYELVSKATARADYYLSDADLKALPALRSRTARR